VAFSTGKLVQIKRSNNIFSIYGKDFSILASCAGHCGYQNVIIVKDGQIVTKDLNIETKPQGGEDGEEKIKKEGGDKQNERDRNGKDGGKTTDRTEKGGSGKSEGDDGGGDDGKDGRKSSDSTKRDDKTEKSK